MNTPKPLYSYEKIFRIDDIPNYPVLFIRDGGFVYETNKSTGEISRKLTLDEYTQVWRDEWEYNLSFRSYHQKTYFFPKDNPDTARNIKDLLKLCSDNTRHRKGDTEYLLDFILSGECTTTETKLFKILCEHVVVWNYSVIDYSCLQTKLELKTNKQVKSVWKSLQDKGLTRVVTEKFETDDGWCHLVKLHPKLFWKGRWTAWAIKNKMDYEYQDNSVLDD